MGSRKTTFLKATVMTAFSLPNNPLDWDQSQSYY